MKSKILLVVLVMLSLIAISSPVMAKSKPTANFYADVRQGYEPLHVHFYSTDVTGDPTSYVWVFEPQTSDDWNSHHPKTAVHTFKNIGSYDVSLIVTNSAGSTTITKKNYIEVDPNSGQINY